jgi:O-antigen/teichoic acid export membrane protein
MVGVARQPLQPALIAMHSLGDDVRLAGASRRGGRYGLWAALMVACPTMVFASDFAVLLLGESLADAPTVILLLMSVFFFNQPAGLLPMIAMARGEVRRFNQLALASTLACFLLMVALVQGLGLGALGAAVAIAVGTALTQVLWMWPLNLRLSKITPADFVRHVLLPGFAPALVATFVWIGFAMTYRPITSWLELLLVPVPGVAVYTATLALFCLDDTDHRVLGKSLPAARRLLPKKFTL